MHINADYHTHTFYSHGEGSIEQNVIAAIDKGLKRIAITDHASAHLFFGVSKSNIIKMRSEVDRMNQCYGKCIEVLLGMEFNILGSDDTDIPVDSSMFDIILLGYHRGVVSSNKSSSFWRFRNFLPGIGSVRREAIRQKNTDIIIATMEKYPVHILTHPCEYILMDVGRMAQAAGRLGVALEINTSHLSMTAEDLKIARSSGANFVIDSDAHEISRIGDFKVGIEVAKEAGLDAADIVNSDEFHSKMRFQFN